MSIERNLANPPADAPEETRFYMAMVDTRMLARVDRRRIHKRLTKKGTVERMCELFLKDRGEM